MDFLVERLSQFMRGYLPQISVAMIATVLALYGGYINDAVKSLLKSHHFIIRFVVFVLLCAFGYGALSIYAAKVVKMLLSQIHDLWLAPVIVVSFIVIGLLAEHKRKI
jgi:hypothetical protein